MIVSKHPGYSVSTVRRASRWAAKQIGLDTAVLRRLNIVVGYRRSLSGNGWAGHYKSASRTVEVLLPRDGEYPTSKAHNAEERAAGRLAADEWELFVGLLAHELEHARCFAISRSREERQRLNSEPRVRATDWRALLEFRKHREALLADWVRVTVPKEPSPALSPADRRAARAVELLNEWGSKLKLAKTKVAKYRKRVKYYGAVAATRSKTDG